MQLAPRQRSILKPASLPELSFQARSIRLIETAVAVKLLGAAGGEGGGNKEKSNRLGDPAPGFVTLLSVAALMIADATVPGEAVGSLSR